MPIELQLPKLGETMLEAVIVRWLKKEGDEVARGEPIVEVETDKAIMEVSAAVAGRLVKVLAPQGASVKVGGVFALVAGDQESPAGQPSPPTAAREPERVAESPAPARPAGGRVPASPAARRLASKLGVALEGVPGTGPDGMIVERDVERAAEAAKAQAEEVEVVPLVGARKVIAERMLESRQTTAQVTTFIDVDVTRVGQLRHQVGASYTAFVVRAVGLALPEFPYLNASLAGERILLRKRIHVGVAVAAGDVLVVPVLRDADKKSLAEIARDLSALAERGRQRQLTSEEMQGATFTVTNPGVFGALLSTPIINLPQSAILGTGRVHRVPVVRGDQITIGEMMYLSLSYDHRLVDGAPAARFLRRLKDLLESPDSLVS